MLGVTEEEICGGILHALYTSANARHVHAAANCRGHNNNQAHIVEGTFPSSAHFPPPPLLGHHNDHNLIRSVAHAHSRTRADTAERYRITRLVHYANSLPCEGYLKPFFSRP